MQWSPIDATLRMGCIAILCLRSKSLVEGQCSQQGYWHDGGCADKQWCFASCGCVLDTLVMKHIKASLSVLVRESPNNFFLDSASFHNPLYEHGNFATCPRLHACSKGFAPRATRFNVAQHETQSSQDTFGSHKSCCCLMRHVWDHRHSL